MRSSPEHARFEAASRGPPVRLPQRGGQGLGKEHDYGYYARVQWRPQETGPADAALHRYYSEPTPCSTSSPVRHQPRLRRRRHRFDVRIGAVKKSYSTSPGTTPSHLRRRGPMDRWQVDYIVPSSLVSRIGRPAHPDLRPAASEPARRGAFRGYRPCSSVASLGVSPFGPVRSKRHRGFPPASKTAGRCSPARDALQLPHPGGAGPATAPERASIRVARAARRLGLREARRHRVLRAWEASGR